MKLKHLKHTLLLLGAFVITLPGISQNQNVEQLVKQTANSWFNSFNNHNYNDYPSYTTEDCFGINPYGLHGKRTSETPTMYNKAHESFLKNLSIRVDSIGVRFISSDVAIATVISQQVGSVNTPAGTDKSFNEHANEKLISTMVIVKQNSKWLITQYQNTFIANSFPVLGTK